MDYQNIAIIDLGSNSVRLMIVRVFEDLSFRLMDEQKETLRLGDGLDADNFLSEQKMHLALKTLKIFKNLCLSQQVTEILAVATAALRKAKNGPCLQARILEEIGLDMQIIPGEQEAYLDFLAVSRSSHLSDALLFDIGGGSFELVWMKNRKMVRAASVPIGSLDIASAFNIRDPLQKDIEKQLNRYIREALQKVPWLEEASSLPVIGIGGTMRTVGKIHMLKKNYPIHLLHGYDIPQVQISQIYEEIKSLPIEQKRLYPGLSTERADIFVGSCAILLQLMKQINSKALVISGKGVREGLFYQYLEKKGVCPQEVLAFSVENTAKNMGLDLAHARQVKKLSRLLFEDLKELHGITEDIGRILDTSAMLHDSGVIINFYNHHRNSFYVILHSPLTGLTHRELLMSAYIASFHKKNKDHTDFAHYQALLGSRDLYIIKAVSVFLRLAESFDKSMNQNVRSLHCSIQRQTVTVKLTANQYPELEILDALEVYPVFKKVFKKDLILL